MLSHSWDKDFIMINFGACLEGFYGAVNGRQQSFLFIVTWITSFSSHHHIFITTYGPTRHPWRGFYIFRPEFRFRPNNSRFHLLKVRPCSTSDYGMRADQPLGGSLQEGLALCHFGTLLPLFPSNVPGTCWTPQEMFVELIINLPFYLQLPLLSYYINL